MRIRCINDPAKKKKKWTLLTKKKTPASKDMSCAVPPSPKTKNLLHSHQVVYVKVGMKVH